MPRLQGIATLFVAVAAVLLVIAIVRGAAWAWVGFGAMALIVLAALIAVIVIARNFRNSFRR